MVRKSIPFLLWIALCEFVGIAGTIFTVNAIPTWYQYLNKPFFVPPNWIFGPVWTILYCLMGMSASLVWNAGKNSKRTHRARIYFITQLILNFAWSLLFFGLQSPLLGLVSIIALWWSIVMCIRTFYGLSRPAAYLMIPYLLWVSFATLLNLSILILN